MNSYEPTASGQVHVWMFDQFDEFEIKTCNCGEMRIEEKR